MYGSAPASCLEDIYRKASCLEGINDFRFELKKKKYIGIDQMIYKKIKKQANKLHTNEDLLVNEWLKEKLGA